MCHLNNVPNVPVWIGRVRQEEVPRSWGTLETIHSSTDPIVAADQEYKRNAQIYITIIYLRIKLMNCVKGLYI